MSRAPGERRGDALSSTRTHARGPSSSFTLLLLLLLLRRRTGTEHDGVNMAHNRSSFFEGKEAKKTFSNTAGQPGQAQRQAGSPHGAGPPLVNTASLAGEITPVSKTTERFFCSAAFHTKNKYICCLGVQQRGALWLS